MSRINSPFGLATPPNSPPITAIDSRKNVQKTPDISKLNLKKRASEEPEEREPAPKRPAIAKRLEKDLRSQEAQKNQKKSASELREEAIALIRSFTNEELLNKFKNREEIPGLVRMKMGSEFPGDGTKGYATLPIMVERPLKLYGLLGLPKNTSFYRYERQNENSPYEVFDANNNKIKLPPGKYNFVTMADGSRRIGKAGHPMLSGSAAYVLSAGVVDLDENEQPIRGCGRSGHYLTPLDSCKVYSGIDCPFDENLSDLSKW